MTAHVFHVLSEVTEEGAMPSAKYAQDPILTAVVVLHAHDVLDVMRFLKMCLKFKPKRRAKKVSRDK